MKIYWKEKKMGKIVQIWVSLNLREGVGSKFVLKGKKGRGIESVPYLLGLRWVARVL